MDGRIRHLAAALAVLALAAAAGAHDFWLAPSKFRPAKGEAVDVRLLNGVEYAGDPVLRDGLRIEKFVVLGPDGTDEVRGEEKADPAGRFTPSKDGTYVVAYRSRRKSMELEAAKFEAYLEEEGLEHVAAARAERRETQSPGREVFSRCAKAIVRVGDARDGFDRVAGLRLEVVPETNPYTSAAGDPLTFRVLFEEKALEKALVVARPKAEPKRTVTARTDTNGRVTLKLDAAREWLVKCVHMVPAPAETGADWESLWATVTFELAAAK